MAEHLNGNIALINLNDSSTEIREISEDILRNYIGGKGLATWLLYNTTSKRINPLGPENPIIFAGGPLTGTIAPAMRGVVVSCSPLTNYFVDSYYGGHLAQEIRYAGYAALMITGKAESPSIITIEDEEIKIISAEKFWGLNTFETSEGLKRELRDDTYKIACIGPAGENLIPFALISCDYNRQAGRGGIGAVMGSKNLKAVAVKGTNLLPVASRDDFLDAVREAREELEASPVVRELTESGTPASLWFADKEGLLPVNNYQKGTFDPEGLAEEAQRKEIWMRDIACASCPIRCSKIGVIKKGKRRGTIADIVEYENAALMGTNLGLRDIKEVAYLVRLCDSLGLDGMSTGSLIGFTMECFERGILRPTDYNGLKLSFGSKENIDLLINQIACRRGKLGQLLAQGTLEAGKKLGREAEDIVMHIKGLDIPAWGPRGVPAMGLAYLTADRGACHQRGFPLSYEISSEYKGEKVERLAVEGKAEMLINDQNYLAALDTFVKCDFGNFGISQETYLKLYQAATGDEMNSERLFKLGERIWNLSRLFNIRQGMTYQEERLPRRCHEPLPDGPVKGHRFTFDDERTMLQEYYWLRGWDEKGCPTRDKLQELNILEEVKNLCG